MTYDATVLADSPTIYLKLDELSGTTCADSSGNGNTFTYQTGVTLGKAGLVADGGTSVAGSGTNAAAILSSVPVAIQNPAAFTLECWVNITNTSESGSFIKVGGNSGTGYGLGVGSTTLDGAGNNIIGLAEGLAWMPSGVAIGTGAHHIVMTRDSSNWKFYKDGSLVATLGAQSITPATTGVNVAGYSNSPNNRFLPSTESVDCVAVYPTALTATRILAHYNAGIPVSTARAFREPVALRTRAVARASSY